ncbi:MAG: molybdopterin molybdenumtransferase MoeA, partial [Planctomycetota bacterium]
MNGTGGIAPKVGGSGQDAAPRPLIPLHEAQRIVLEHVHALEEEEVILDEALHRVLARPVVTDVDDPPFDRSVMDGYAVRAADVADAPVRLRVVGAIPAGTVPERSIRPGECMQINTGAMMPDGADAVVRVEATEPVTPEPRASHASETEPVGEVLIRTAVEPGTFVARRGDHVQKGEVVLEAGTRMTPGAVGAAAAAGATLLHVRRRPQVAVLVTGSELVSPAEVPVGAQIRNS